MIYIYKDRIINIQWTVMKGTSCVRENFDRALLKLFLIGPHEKYLLEANASEGVVSAEVPAGLPEGTYSVELIYVKNWQSLTRPPKLPERHPVDCRFYDRCIMRSRKDDLFAITNYETESENIGKGEVVVRLKTSVASYGYDGLSAYEIAVMRGDFTGTEGEWMDTVGRSINMYYYSYLGNSEDTRLQVPSYLRRTGLWISYVKDDKTVVTEWYDGDDMSDDAWKLDSNWRIGSNMLVGDLTISSEGNWVVNGTDTGVKAQGEQGITPMIRIYDNKLQVSYNNGKLFIDVADNPVYTQFRVQGNKLQASTDLGKTWSDMSDYIAAWFRNHNNKLQISRDNVNWESVSDYIAAWFKWSEDNRIQISRTNADGSWQNMSPVFADNVYIKGYLSNISKAPADSTIGSIYMVGPNSSNQYEMYVKTSDGWKNNGAFTSVAPGIVQDLGDSETEAMSQKAVTDEFNKIRRVFDGGRADSVYGGARSINCGGAQV